MTGAVIIVEDNPMNMKLLEQALSIAGYHIIKSVDGDGLVEIAAVQPIMLVLMDIQLPRWSGVELLKALRADPRTVSIPVVAVTAFADPESIAGFKADGFNDVVTKPVSIRALLDKVDGYRQQTESTSA
jgi:two-component system, cell cycle response regulator DivK